MHNLIGKTICFGRESFQKLDEYDIDFEPGMRADVVSITKEANLLRVELDFSKYEEHNKALMSANFFDGEGKPCLKWCDTKYYPADKRVPIWIQEKDLSMLQVEVATVTVPKEKVNELLELARSISPSMDMATDNNAVMLAQAVIKVLGS